jgi:SAM-dependent methyltransferase
MPVTADPDWQGRPAARACTGSLALPLAGMEQANESELDGAVAKWSLGRGRRPDDEWPEGPVTRSEAPAGDGSAVWDQLADRYGTGPSPFASFAERLVRRAGLTAGETVLDLGCGNGLGLIHAAAAVAPGRAMGVDFSDEMLAVAAERVEGAGLTNVTLKRMDVGHLQFPDGAFDVALASSVVQFVGYSVAVLREWRRILHPDGRLILSVPRPVGALEMPVRLMLEFFPRLPAEVRRRLLPVPPPPTPDLVTLCRKAGFKAAETTVETFPFTLPSREAWWDLQWTHGIRAFLSQFDRRALTEFKAAALESLAPVCLPSGELSLTATVDLCTALA